MYCFSCCVTGLPPPSRTLECCRGGRARKSAAHHSLTSYGPVLSERQSNTRVRILAIFVSTPTPACRWFYCIILQEKWSAKAFHLLSLISTVSVLIEMHMFGSLFTQSWPRSTWAIQTTAQAEGWAHAWSPLQGVSASTAPPPWHSVLRLTGLRTSSVGHRSPEGTRTWDWFNSSSHLCQCQVLNPLLAHPPTSLCPQMRFYLVNSNCLVGCLPFPDFPISEI